MRHQQGTFSAFIIRLAIGATALSVAVMILSMAFIGGFKYEIREKLFSFWGEVLIVPFDASTSDISAGIPVKMDKQLMANVKSMKQVTAVYPFVVRPGIIQHASEMEGIRLKGVQAGQKFPQAISFSGAKIGYEDTNYSQDIILSKTTTERLRVKIGDDIKLYFLNEGTPRIRKLHVAGTYHTGMEEIDKQFALCDMRLVQHLSSWLPDDVSGYQVEIADKMQADSMAAKIYYEYINPPMNAQSITDVYGGVFSWLSTQDTNGRIILIIVAIVAFINLASSMLILMVDRAVMIGLLKALGMTPKALWSLFLYIAALIGGLGILFGNILGLGLAFCQQKFHWIKLPEETYNVSSVPVRLVWWHVVVLDLCTFCLCLFCALLPLLYIRRIQAAKVLSFE
ncbi:MAG: FtsX-like permease family protein [Chitinophagaceae bacterium]